MKTNWQEIGYPLPSKEQRMKMTSENYYKIIAMRDELIFEQKDEIAMLKMKINQLQLKLKLSAIEELKMLMNNKVKNIIYSCAVSGVVARNAICEKVSVASDEKGHRCMAHGNTKCRHKINNRL